MFFQIPLLEGAAIQNQKYKKAILSLFCPLWNLKKESRLKRNYFIYFKEFKKLRVKKKLKLKNSLFFFSQSNFAQKLL